MSRLVKHFFGFVVFVASMLTAGCFQDVNALDENGRTALHRAAKAGDLEEVKRLLGERAKVNIADTGDYTPLFYAVDEKHVDVARALIAGGADLFYRFGPCKRTYLHRAARWDDRAMVELLVDSGADMEAHDEEMFCAGMPLHRAAQCDSVKAIAFFLEKNQSVDLRSQNGMTPLHFTAGYGNTGSMKAATLLLERGADVNASGAEGYTPLHLAALWGKLDLVKLFVENGADRDRKTEKGETAADLAAKPEENERRQRDKKAVLDFLALP